VLAGRADVRRGLSPFPFPGNSTGAETMLYDLPWWVMILMLLAVIGLIVLLIYLRKKDREG
jgi:flagellar biogenesis protein FliO